MTYSGSLLCAAPDGVYGTDDEQYKAAVRGGTVYLREGRRGQLVRLSRRDAKRITDWAYRLKAS